MLNKITYTLFTSHWLIMRLYGWDLDFELSSDTANNHTRLDQTHAEVERIIYCLSCQYNDQLLMQLSVIDQEYDLGK